MHTLAMNAVSGELLARKPTVAFPPRGMFRASRIVLSVVQSRLAGVPETTDARAAMARIEKLAERMTSKANRASAN
jgi:hypothetical protein